jgi:hypothetical protein
VVGVADFPTDDATRTAGATSRAIRIDKLDGKPLTAGSAALTDTTNFLGAQVAPYRPMDLTLVDPEGGATSPTLLVSYDAPGPMGLIAPKH